MKKISTMRLLPLFLSFTLFLAACQGKDPDNNGSKSNDCTLKSFEFTSVNVGVGGNSQGLISRTYAPDSKQVRPLVLVTVPVGCNLASLKPSFTIHEKATLYINDIEQVSGQSNADFRDVVTIKVVAEAGSSMTYDVIVKEGEPVFDSMVYNFMSSFSIPGVSISVSNGGDIIYSYGYGFADVENRVKTTPNHLFRLASVSKQFTTTCIMKLYEDGKLNLDDTVFGTGGILDEEFPGVIGNKAEVTIRQFLNHTSGWKSDPYDPQFDSPYKSWSLDEQIKDMLKTERRFSGSTNYSYYNLGFGILGKVIEKVSGKGFEEYLKEVMALAGVSDVHVGRDRTGKRSNECVYYSQGGTNGYGNNMEAIAAAGGIIASTEEMMKLIVKLDGKGDDDILQKATIEEMYKPSSNADDNGNLRYALGWRLGHRLYPGAHYHSGNIAGTASIWCGDANNGISAVILMNSRNYSVTNSSGDFDDNYYVLLGDIVSYFGNL